MCKFVVFAIVCIAASAALPFEMVEDENGDQYYLLPADFNHQRVRRQTSGNIGSDGAGLSHTGTILNNQNHKLDGTASVFKPFPGPVNVGGNLDYTHKPSGSGLSAGAQTARGMGTDFTASGTYNVFRSNNGRTTAGVTGEYNRHFGGPQGTQKPNYGVLFGLKHRF